MNDNCSNQLILDVPRSILIELSPTDAVDSASIEDDSDAFRLVSNAMLADGADLERQVIHIYYCPHHTLLF